MEKNKNKNKNRKTDESESASSSSVALKKVREDPSLPSHVVDAFNELIEKYNNKKIEEEDDVIELIEKEEDNKGKKPETGGSGIKNDDEAISLSLPDRVEKYLKAYMAGDNEEMKFDDWLFRDNNIKEDEKDDIRKNVAKEVEKGKKMDVTSIICALNESTLFIRKLEDQMKKENENSRYYFLSHIYIDYCHGCSIFIHIYVYINYRDSSAAKKEPKVKAKRKNRKKR